MVIAHKAAAIDALFQSLIDEEVHAAISQTPLEGVPMNVESGTKVIFHTEDDERVCDLCLSYQDEEYSVDDPDRPDLPLHPNCRCWFEHSDLPIEFE